MTRNIARLVLAMLTLPFAGIVFVAMFAAGALFAANARAGTGPSTEGVLVAWMTTHLFVIIYWIGIWRSSIRWTQHRIVMTLGAIGLGAFAAALGVAGLLNLAGIPITPSVLFGNALFPLVFVVTSVYIWRETPAERFERTARRGVDTVACPICGYNMTGLREARCPECGAAFSLDELLSAQFDRHREELPETDTETT